MLQLINTDGSHLTARNLGDRHNTRDAGLCRGWFDPGPRHARRSAHASDSLHRCCAGHCPAFFGLEIRRRSSGERAAPLSSAAFFAAAASPRAFSRAPSSAAASRQQFVSGPPSPRLSLFASSFRRFRVPSILRARPLPSPSRAARRPCSLRSISAGSGLGGPALRRAGVRVQEQVRARVEPVRAVEVRARGPASSRCLSARARRPPWLRWRAFRPAEDDAST